MVSIDAQLTLQNSLNKSPKALALFNYLKSLPQTDKPLELGKTDRTYYSMIDSLYKNDGALFNRYYEELSERKVSKELPILYDNFLLFVIITGVIKFNLKTDWIKSLIALRATLNEPEKSITASFNYLLNKNYLTTDGIPSIVLASLFKIDNLALNTSLLKNSFHANNDIIRYLERDLFLVSICLFTTEYIISISISDESSRLKQFENTFLKRISNLENIFYVLLLLLLIVIWFWTLKRYPNIKDSIGDLGTFLGIVGIGVLAVPLNYLKGIFGKAIKVLLGYKMK